MTAVDTQTRALETVVIGFGKIGAAYAEDVVMAQHYRYATHAQALRDHPAFLWRAVVDPDPEARRAAREKWKIQICVPEIKDLPRDFRPGLAVLASPPGERIQCIRDMPWLQAVLVEKPLGNAGGEAQAFVAACERRNILVQVNLWRRSDRVYTKLAQGELAEFIGRPQAAFCIYGNGLRNNGTHMVDFCRMLFGEVKEIYGVGRPVRPEGLPLKGDLNVGFCLCMADGARVAALPVDFACFRENSLDIWGEKGRLSIYQEGLFCARYPLAANRAMQRELEIESDRPTVIPASVGDALYRMYDNLAGAVAGREKLVSPGDSALATESVVERIFAAANEKEAAWG